MNDITIPFLSIIVPIYHVEEYLRQCVDSILNQTFHDFELILVDDGSNDACPEICDGYAGCDPRVTVIHKENGGLSDARNAGIHASHGRYLLFIDADDFIAEDSLAQVVYAIQNDKYPDVLFLKAEMYFKEGVLEPYGQPFKKEELYGIPKEQVVKKLSAGRQFHVSACIKAVSRELIISKEVFFTKGIIGEDVDYSIKLYLNALTYSYLDFPYYYYRQDRKGSIMMQKSDKRFHDLLYIIQKWITLSDDLYIRDKNLILSFLYHQYYVLVLLYHNLSKSLKTPNAKTLIDSFSYLLKYTDNKKAYMIYIIYNMLGLRITSCFINWIEARYNRQ